MRWRYILIDFLLFLFLALGLKASEEVSKQNKAVGENDYSATHHGVPQWGPEACELVKEVYFSLSQTENQKKFEIELAKFSDGFELADYPDDPDPKTGIIRDYGTNLLGLNLKGQKGVYWVALLKRKALTAEQQPEKIYVIGYSPEKNGYKFEIIKDEGADGDYDKTVRLVRIKNKRQSCHFRKSEKSLPVAIRFSNPEDEDTSGIYLIQWDLVNRKYWICPEIDDELYNSEGH